MGRDLGTDDIASPPWPHTIIGLVQLAGAGGYQVEVLGRDGWADYYGPVGPTRHWAVWFWNQVMDPDLPPA